jgi:threonine synthase
VSFAVPTGNFGNVYAAYGARAMGLPIERLVVGTNSNDILARFFATGTMATADVTPTISPSMDIQISSNFERLLFDLYDRDGAALNECMGRFRSGGSIAVTPEQLSRARLLFNGHKVDEDLTSSTMTDTRRMAGGLLIDPHTAVGLAAARAEQPHLDPAVPLVALACAHPAKFPDAVERATGVRPPLPPRLADLYEREERVTVLPNDLKTVQDFVRSRARRTASATLGAA